jgi:hypothetical protein
LTRVRDRRSPSHESDHRFEIRVVSGAFDQEMKMILHEDVCKDIELTLFARTQYFRCRYRDNGCIDEQLPAQIGRTRDEIAMFAFVVKRLQPRRPSSPHV